MDRLDDFLQQREVEGLLRTLKPADWRRNGVICHKGVELVDCSSNDYLGLADHPKLKQAAKEALDKFGTSAGASRLLSGDLQIHHELEEATARFKGKEAALVFNSGYQANAGIISSLCSSVDAVFADRFAHASILDGISLSGAKLFRFAHNDAEHLKSLLKKAMGNFDNRLIVTESVFSMDGDRAPLKELVELKEMYGCQMLVDEAHATGIFGRDGAGVVSEEGLSQRVELIMGTFSKALGSFGGYVAASRKMRDYLINTSRSFIYSTALPPAVIGANVAAIEVVKAEGFRRTALLERAAFLRNALAGKGFEVRGDSQIVPLIVGDAGGAIEMSERLQKQGFWVLPIRPPTVGPNQARLRFSLNFGHSRADLERLVEHTGEGVRV
jgi:8-amino-7-oxononanoate synthase